MKPAADPLLADAPLPSSVELVLRFGAVMNDAETAPGGVTVRVLLDSCGEDPVGLRDAALFSLAYDAGLRVSELVGTTVADRPSPIRRPIRTGTEPWPGSRPRPCSGSQPGCWRAGSGKARCSGGSIS